jgi:deoxyribose-phosphate aldolase
MEIREIMAHIDHTLLKPYAAWPDIEKLCREAVLWKTASVCIPPYYIARARESFSDLRIATVVGFPLGYEVREAKEAETRCAIADGADEIDMVINVAAVKSVDYDTVSAEIRALREITEENGKILKVIVETCYLTEEEKIRMCRIVTEEKADYIKTSTGFGKAGAALSDVLLFRKYIGPAVKIKAAGGIRSREDMEAYLEAGCDRIGTSGARALAEKAGYPHA